MINFCLQNIIFISHHIHLRGGVEGLRGSLLILTRIRITLLSQHKTSQGVSAKTPPGALGENLNKER